MKKLLTVSLCTLTLALTSFGQTNPPPPAAASSPAAAGATNPAAPATQMPPANAAPATQMPTNAAPAAPGVPPAANTTAPGAPANPAAPQMAPTAPAPVTAGTPTPGPSAAPATAKDLSTGNLLIDKFHKGGPIMWPILLVSIIAIAVVLERVFWWLFRWMRRDPKRIEKVFTAIESGDVAEASRLSRGSRDPVLRMMWNGLNHQHASLQGALQVAAGIEIKRAGRFLVVMDTLVTLAPLLGLLGTITGLMKSFGELGNEELAVQAVTGGISEALIATAGGLGIAIFALIPFNFFTSRVSNLEFELQTAATNLEVMLEAQNKVRRETEVEATR